ncbi:MAG: hypothetical protein HZA06_04215 [Nitrospirae bacterium]|nr:hypothetical protein [Nitrospirota bacterium]
MKRLLTLLGKTVVGWAVPTKGGTGFQPVRTSARKGEHIGSPLQKITKPSVSPFSTCLSTGRKGGFRGITERRKK